MVVAKNKFSCLPKASVGKKIKQSSVTTRRSGQLNKSKINYNEDSITSYDDNFETSDDDDQEVVKSSQSQAQFTIQEKNKTLSCTVTPCKSNIINSPGSVMGKLSINSLNEQEINDFFENVDQEADVEMTHDVNSIIINHKITCHNVASSPFTNNDDSMEEYSENDSEESLTDASESKKKKRKRSISLVNDEDERKVKRTKTDLTFIDEDLNLSKSQRLKVLIFLIDYCL